MSFSGSDILRRGWRRAPRRGKMSRKRIMCERININSFYTPSPQRFVSAVKEKIQLRGRGSNRAARLKRTVLIIVKPGDRILKLEICEAAPEQLTRHGVCVSSRKYRGRISERRREVRFEIETTARKDTRFSSRVEACSITITTVFPIESGRSR